jgi:hypothetical protein
MVPGIRMDAEVVGPVTVDEAREMTGSREGERFLFGYGALLDSSVWRMRGIDETRGGRRRALRVVAVGRGLKFNVQGGYASVELLHEMERQPEAHGIVLPVSQQEILRHAAKERGYFMETIRVRAYGSNLEIEALAFVSKPWAQAENMRPSEGVC